MSNKETFDINVYYRLLYFYFIKPESVVEDVKNIITAKKYTEGLSEENLPSLFDDIFETILKYSSPYTDYLNVSGGQNAFFGENFYQLNGRSYVGSNSVITRNALKFSLLHHCIIQSFYKELEKSTNPTFRYEMTARYYSRFQCGYFEYLAKIEKKGGDESLDEKWNSIEKRSLYSQRYKTFRKLDDAAYSKKILFSLLGQPTINTKHKGAQPSFLVIPYFSLWADFMFAEKSVHYFDNALSSPKQLLKKYRTLFERSREPINLANKGSDKLLVSYPLEYFYAFQTFDGIFRLLTDIYNCQGQTETALSYADFQGREIIDIIKLLKDIPLVYNRHFLIYFACEAIVKGGLSESRYLKIRPRNPIYYMPVSSNSKVSQISDGFVLMQEFLLHMKTVAIPLITDLWNYIIFSINDSFDTLKLKLKLEQFRMYIDKYYPLITTDWITALSQEITDYDFFQPSSTEMMYFRKHLMEISQDKNSKTELDFLIPKRNPTLKSYMEELLRSYCNPEQLPTFPPKYENLLDPLCHPFMDSSGISHEKNRLKQLQLDHARFLYELSTKPFHELD